MNRATFDQQKRLNRLASEGWDVSNQNQLPVYRSEDTFHWFAKAAFAFQLWDEKAGFLAECEHEHRGIADLVDPNPSEKRAKIYEVESGYSPSVAREKASQYGAFDKDSLVSDVLTIDISHVNRDTTLGELMELAETEVV